MSCKFMDVALASEPISVMALCLLAQTAVHSHLFSILLVCVATRFLDKRLLFASEGLTFPCAVSF